LHRRALEAAANRAAELALRQSHDRCEAVEREFFVEMAVDVPGNRADLPAGEAALGEMGSVLLADALACGA
jgi:hypothetical protein